MNHPPNRSRLFIWTAALLLMLWIGFGNRLLTHWAYAVEQGRLQANADELADTEQLASLRAISKAFRMVAKVARPGVVSIEASGGEVTGMASDELLRMYELFGDRLTKEEWEQLLQRTHRLPPTSGSGIIFDENGHIVTNNHVVEHRTEISIRLSDDRVYEATLVGNDPKTDLAVIKIEADDLHPLVFGDSDKAAVGDWVVAVGAPFRLAQTVTHGIVSATGRTRIPGLENIVYQNFIQTDAAVNPGNSGGPLLNLRGQVLGVNTAIATHGDSHAGIAFAIPANMAVSVARQLIAHGQVARGWLGITYPTQPLTENEVEIFKLPNKHGILISEVLKDSPAEAAGLQVEDAIIAVNGEDIMDMAYFSSAIADLGPNEDVTLRIIRDGHEQTIKGRLGLQPQNTRRRDLLVDVTKFREVPSLGLSVLSLHSLLTGSYPQLAKVYDELTRGVVIFQLDVETDAADKLKAGEVITGVEGQPVINVGELNAALKAAGNQKRIRLQILQPDGDRRIIHVRRRP